MKIVVINLDIATARLEKFYTNARKHDITNITRFSAIDKEDTCKLNELNQKYDVDINLKPHWHKIGVNACFVSHILVWEDFLYNNPDEKYLCVLEDDAKFVKGGFEDMTNLCKNINVPEDQVDIMYISDRVASDSKNKVCNGCGTEGYIVTKKGVEKLLQCMKPGIFAIDLQMQAHYEVFRKNNHLQQYLTRKDIVIKAYKSKYNYVIHEDEGSSYIR